MGFGGLIAGALKGAAEGTAQYAQTGMKQSAELDMRKELLAVEAEKKLAIDEITRGRDIRDIGVKTAATATAEAAAAPVRAAGVVAGDIAKVNAATAGGLADKNAAFRAAELKANANNVTTEAEQKAAGETAGLLAKVKTPGYLDAVAKNAKAGQVESAGSLATAALANFELGNKKNVVALQTQLSKETDPVKRETLQTQIRDLSGGSTKSYSDVVALGNGYVNMAGKLRSQAKDEFNAEAKASLNSQAEQYEQAANSVFSSVSEKRLGVGGGAPKPGATGSPYKDGARLSKQENGKTVFYVVKNGVPVPE